MESLAKKYPKYYKALPPGVKPDEVDTYAINVMFPVDDPTGTIIHARKKLLIPGVRSGGKFMLKDVIEARDTLNRYIALHEAMEEPALEPVEDTAPVPGTVVEGGWIVHGGNDMPEALDPSDLVEVRLEDGVEYVGNFAKQAGEWKWFTDGRCAPISHYRLMRCDDSSDELVGALDHSLALVGEHGWYALESFCRPSGVPANASVQVRLSNGHTVMAPRKAKQWRWDYRQEGSNAAPHIEAWRFA